MRIFNRLVATVVAAIALGAVATPASAQATRTWVSGVGDDVNPCSRTAPCKTFAGAISKTAAGGEINCLDPGGYGTLTITKSITVDCTGTMGSSLNSGGINGFVISDSATATPNTIDVILRGLSIDGAGTTQGLNGIRFISGRSLYVEDVIIQNQSNAGVSVAPGGAAEIHLNNVTVTDVANGVFVQPTGAGGSAKVFLGNVRLANSSNIGLRVDSSGNTNAQGISVVLSDSEISGGGTGVSLITGVGTNRIVTMVSGSTIANNTATGLLAFGSNSLMRVSDSTITANALGVSATSGGLISSFQNNVLAGNPTVGAANDGSFSSTSVLQ